MSEEWDDEANARGVDPVVKQKAKEVKKIVSDTSMWLRASASVRFLLPLVSLTQMMGTDDGDALPFFYIMMVSIKLLWNTNTADSVWQFNDVTTGYCGVPVKQAIEVNRLLFEKLKKHKHPLQAVAALLHPYNISPMTELDSNYKHIKIGERPCEGVLE